MYTFLIYYKKVVLETANYLTKNEIINLLLIIFYTFSDIKI